MRSGLPGSTTRLVGNLENSIALSLLFLSSSRTAARAPSRARKLSFALASLRAPCPDPRNYYHCWATNGGRWTSANSAVYFGLPQHIEVGVDDADGADPQLADIGLDRRQVSDDDPV